MNNSLDRLLDGIVAALRRDVIPRLDDEYASGQALAVVDLITMLRPRLDWAVPPLRQRVQAQQALLAELEGLLGPRAGQDRITHDLNDLAVDGRGLQGQSDRLDALIGTAVRDLDDSNASIAARTAIHRYLHTELRRDMALTPRPLFAEIARGADGPA